MIICALEAKYSESHRSSTRINYAGHDGKWWDRGRAGSAAVISRGQLLVSITYSAPLKIVASVSLSPNFKQS